MSLARPDPSAAPGAPPAAEFRNRLQIRPRPGLGLLALGLLAGGSAGADTAATSLQPPSGYRAAPGHSNGSALPCTPAPTPFTGSLDFPSKYEGSGSARDVLNPRSEAEYQRLTLPITEMERGVVSRITRHARSGQLQDLACVVDWMNRWAEAGALLGKAPNHSGRARRKWTLGSLSSAWLRLQFAEGRPLDRYPEQQQRIQQWLSTVADRVALEWPADAPLRSINNHSYWAAWSLMAAAVVSDRRDLFEQSLRLYRVFEGQLDAEGYLPNELRRATLAASYHNYAIAPLAMIAAFAEANGRSLVTAPQPALTRLANRAMVALVDPSVFERRTGSPQSEKGLSADVDRAWLEPYCWTVRCPLNQQAMLAAARPLSSTRLGGDLTALYANTARLTP